LPKCQNVGLLRYSEYLEISMLKEESKFGTFTTWCNDRIISVSMIVRLPVRSCTIFKRKNHNTLVTVFFKGNYADVIINNGIGNTPFKNEIHSCMIGCNFVKSKIPAMRLQLSPLSYSSGCIVALIVTTWCLVPSSILSLLSLIPLHWFSFPTQSTRLHCISSRLNILHEINFCNYKCSKNFEDCSNRLEIFKASHKLIRHCIFLRTSGQQSAYLI